MKRLIIVLFVASLTALSCNSKSGNRKAKSEQSVLAEKEGFLKVTKIVDGDTFWADDGSEKGIKIRLIGVDAPESRNVFNKKKGYYGEEAKTYLSNMFDGQSVRLEYDVEASVVHNLEAPLLLGQSALSKFGKLTIDYNENKIVFD